MTRLGDCCRHFILRVYKFMSCTWQNTQKHRGKKNSWSLTSWALFWSHTLGFLCNSRAWGHHESYVLHVIYSKGRVFTESWTLHWKTQTSVYQGWEIHSDHDTGFKEHHNQKEKRSSNVNYRKYLVHENFIFFLFLGENHL